LVAGLMLCLLAHALLVDLTHHHPVKPVRTSSAGAIAEIQGESDARSESSSSRESACPSCRLHNTFSSQGRSSSVTVELAARAVDYVARILEPHTEGVPLLLSSRAPPLI
jgi:hypothetical protein